MSIILPKSTELEIQQHTLQHAINLMGIGAYNAYINSFHDRDKFKWFSCLLPGDLVVETSSVGRYSHYDKHVGYLISQNFEPMYTEEEWEECKNQYDGEKRPQERVYRIRLFSDYSEFSWTNASFIRVPTSAYFHFKCDCRISAFKCDYCNHKHLYEAFR